MSRDARVPWVGNEEWTRGMGYPVTEAWRPWDVHVGGRNWVGGFVTQYGANFTFLTIKHAGSAADAAPQLSALSRASLRVLTAGELCVLCAVYPCA